MKRALHVCILAFLAVTTAMIAACATNPATGKRDFVLISENDELAMGREADPQIRKQYGVYANPALQRYVQSVGEQIARKSHRPNLVYRFTVLDSSEVNAFALPGGYIYITRGIMAYLNSEAELAAVLGHEAGHVTARHAVVQISKVKSAEIGLAIGSIFRPELQNQAVQSIVGVLANVILTGYGRENELQADSLGAEYIARVGYDPQAMLGVLTVLKNQEEVEKKRAAAEGREPQIYHGVFASHPSADKRLQEVIGEANKAKTSGSPRVGREEYQKHIEGMVFGDGAHEGVRRGSNFYHSELNIAVSFPNGWRLENSPTSVNAYSPDKNALMQMLVDDLNKRISPKEYLHSRVRSNSFTDERPVEGSALPSHAAIVRLNTPFGQRPTRVMVVIQNNRAYTLVGTAKDDETMRRMDSAFLATAKGMRGLSESERKLTEGLRLRLVTAQPGDTFAALAKRSPISDHAELTLRAINDKLKGEPTPGEMIKIVQ